MNEYTHHRQCQTCFVLFPSNEELLDHVEEYRTRERLLVAELERCRMHIARSNNTTENSDDNCSSKEDKQGLSAQQCPLLCPFYGCGKSFTVRSNLLRHFQQHVPCNDTCPSCFGPFTQVSQLIRHTCKADRKDSDEIRVQQWIAHHQRRVTRELDRWETLGKRKRRLEAMDPDSERLRKVAKENPTETAFNAILDQYFQLSSLQAAGSEAKGFTQKPDATAETVAMDQGSINIVETGTDGGHVSADVDFNPSSSHPFSQAGIVMDDGEWAFASTSVDMPVSNDARPLPSTDGEWAFADPDINLFLDNGSGTDVFASDIQPLVHTVPNMTMADGEWAFAVTRASMAAITNEWANTTQVQANEGFSS